MNRQTLKQKKVRNIVRFRLIHNLETISEKNQCQSQLVLDQDFMVCFHWPLPQCTAQLREEHKELNNHTEFLKKFLWRRKLHQALQELNNFPQTFHSLMFSHPHLKSAPISQENKSMDYIWPPITPVVGLIRQLQLFCIRTIPK